MQTLAVKNFLRMPPTEKNKLHGVSVREVREFIRDTMLEEARLRKRKYRAFVKILAFSDADLRRVRKSQQRA